MPDLAFLPTGTPAFVDTNIFFLHFRGNSATCSAFIDRIAREEVTAYVNTQVLSDLLHKLMLAEACGKGLISKQSAANLKTLLASNRMIATHLVDYQIQFENILMIGLKVLPITSKLLVDTKVERSTHGLMTGDSLHMGNMNRHSNPIHDIVTYDGDFGHISDLNVWKPMDVV
jgi:predicted nucleic acid-binding protein